MKNFIISFLLLLSVSGVINAVENNAGDFVVSADVMKLIDSAVENVDKATRDRFESLYKEWTDTIQNDSSIRIQSIGTGYTSDLRQFTELVAMGDKVLPLAVKKMVTEPNHLSRALYCYLQQSEELKPRNTGLSEKDLCRHYAELWLEGR